MCHQTNSIQLREGYQATHLDSIVASNSCPEYADFVVYHCNLYPVPFLLANECTGFKIMWDLFDM